MKKLNNRGMAPVFIVLITLAVVGVGFAGYRVYENSKDKKQSTNAAPKTEAQQETKQEDNSAQTKEFVSSNTGISFTYPATWVVTDKTEKANENRGDGYEGEIYVTSPDGLSVYINPSFGGKGGDCPTDPSDQPHKTVSCSTIEILSKEKTGLKVDVGNSDQAQSDIYLVKTKFTNGSDSSIKGTYYNVYLTNYDYAINASEALIGAYLDYGTIERGLKPLINTYLKSDKLNNQSYLESADVQSAVEIYESLKLN